MSAPDRTLVPSRGGAPHARRQRLSGALVATLASLSITLVPSSVRAEGFDPTRIVREWIRDWQQNDPPQAQSRVIPGGPGATVLSLDDLSHPIALEQRIRGVALSDPAGLRIEVPGGSARLGAYAIAADQSVEGHLVVLHGPVDVYGRLRGNLVAFSGDIVLHPGSVVTGDVLAIDGDVRDQGGEVTGQIRTLSGRSVAGATAARSIPARLATNLAGVLGAFLTLLLVGTGVVLFGRPPLEIISDTVSNSFMRSFVTGLLGQILILPTFGMLVVGLILTVAGILLVPFVVIVFGLLLVAAMVGGAIAVAHAMGESWTRRRMAQGVMVAPNSLRYLLIGLSGPLMLWLVWALFGWVPVAGGLIKGAAILVTWILVSVGFGSALLSRGGFREQFAGRIVPPEMLTDEYLWATPRFGVPAAKRPEKSDKESGK